MGALRFLQSERRDLNPRPHGPEPCALNQAAPLSGHFMPSSHLTVVRPNTELYRDRWSLQRPLTATAQTARCPHPAG